MNKYWLLTLLAISFSCKETIINHYESNNNIFPNGNFEMGSLYGWAIEGARDSSILIVNDSVFEGSYAARLTLYPGDFIHAGHRVELSRINCAEFQTEMMYSWMFKIGEEFIDGNKFYTINQFHDYPDFLNGETWETMTVYPPPIFTQYLQDTVYIYSHSIEDGIRLIGKREIKKGKWIKIKYKIKWSLENDGFVEAFINSTPVTEFNGIDYKFYTPTLYNKVGNYFKVGLYTDLSVLDTNSIYIDNLFISFL